MAKQEGKLLGITKAAEILGVHPLTVRNWAEKGYLPFLRTPGGHRRFRRDDLEEFLRQMGQEAREPALVTVARQAVQQAIATRQTKAINPIWQADIPVRQRDAMRSIGRNLLGLVIQYVGGNADEAVLERGRKIAQTYGKFARQKNMTVSEMVATFNFFRNTIIEVTFESSVNTGEIDSSNPQLYQRLNHFMNEILLATIEAIEGEMG